MQCGLGSGLAQAAPKRPLVFNIVKRNEDDEHCYVTEIKLLATKAEKCKLKVNVFKLILFVSCTIHFVKKKKIPLYTFEVYFALDTTTTW